MAPQPAPSSSQKRKAPDGNTAVSSLARKRQKTQAIRSIPFQSTDGALSATGELDVAAFVKAREYEINALEKSMQNSRHGLTTRAFQQVPRNMRRRTASHNVKKVPRRLRRRAEREMNEDNTPTVTSRRRTPSAKMRLRLETAKRIKGINSKYKSARARTKEAKRNAAETDPEAHVSMTMVPRIKKNTLEIPPGATSKFKKRQIHKTWLPTHLWHAKRAHLTKPSEPLWRMAIPLTPTEKSYRPSHRASGGRGAIAWDMSYMSTMGCAGLESSLIAMLRAIGFGGDELWGVKGKKWRKGTRSANGWAHERDNERIVIGPLTVIWEAGLQNSPAEFPKCVAVNSVGTEKSAAAIQVVAAAPSNKSKSPKRKLILCVHPSAFFKLWTELLKVAKLQHPPVILEDLRFEIASVDITGPCSTEALCAVLQPITPNGVPETCSAQTWLRLSGLTNPASLPSGAVLGFNISDPRLTHPRKSLVIDTDENSHDEITDLIVDWRPDSSPFRIDLFSHKARRVASRSLPSQKAINRRKSEIQPGEVPPSKETDPQIPVMLLASRPGLSARGAQGTWTVLLPWKCLDPIWRCLMYYPLSSGGTPRFGGLDEKRQIAFERNEPWFPGDFPGTEAGITWERSESQKRYDLWKRKPPSRRVNYDVLKLTSETKGEHGNGWACDWDFLLGLAEHEPKAPSNEQESLLPSSNIPSTENAPTVCTNASTVESKSATEAPDENKPSSSAKAATTTTFTQLPPTRACTLLNPSSTSLFILPALPTKPFLATIRLTLLTRGTPLPCARIYRLPSPIPSSSAAGAALGPKYLSLHPQIPSMKRTKKDRSNWRNDPALHTAYSDEHEDIEAINYRPPNMVPEAVTEWERKREEGRRKREKFQLLKNQREAGKRGGGDGDGGEDSGAGLRREELMRDLMMPSADKGNEAGGQVECPGPGDLIGFVTSGGYNLGVGRGTGVGGLWVQRVLEGWGAEEWPERGAREAKSLEKERRLCIVRNAGETVGRLGTWEACE